MNADFRRLLLVALIVSAQSAMLPLVARAQENSDTTTSTQPPASQSGQSDQNGPATGVQDGQGAGRFGGRFRNGSRWQTLTPEQKQAVLKRIRERRAQQSGSDGATGAGTSAAGAGLGPGNGLGSGLRSGNGLGSALGSGSRLGAGRRGRGAAEPEPTNLADVTVQHDVAYGKDPLQKLDVYAPKVKPEKPMPVVIFVHGGGWSRGDKNQGDRKSKGYAYVAEGIIFVSTNYRLAPNVMHPKQVQDIAQATSWVKTHASEFGGDPNKIFLMGHSAGAHLVDLLGTNDKYLTEAGLSLKDIKGVISLDTASLNLTTRRNDEGPETGLVGPMIDTAFGKDPAALKDGSPTLSIQSGKTYPPFLMFCGSKRINCVQQHRAFETAMHKVGGQVTVTPVPLSHADVNKASGKPGTEVFKGCMQMIKGT